MLPICICHTSTPIHSQESPYVYVCQSFPNTRLYLFDSSHFVLYFTQVPLKISGELIISNVPEALEKHLFIQGENVLGTMATCTEWELYEDLLGFQLPKIGTSAAGLKAKIERNIGVGNQSAKPIPVFLLDHKPGLRVQSKPPLPSQHHTPICTEPLHLVITFILNRWTLYNCKNKSSTLPLLLRTHTCRIHYKHICMPARSSMYL
eukprot:jgi/Botrbrau1/4538/Bobra.60_2s0026.1